MPKVSYIRYNQPYAAYNNPNMKFQLVIRSYSASDFMSSSSDVRGYINGAIDSIDVASDFLGTGGPDVYQSQHVILRAVGKRVISGYNYHLVESLANACDSFGIADKTIEFTDNNGVKHVLEQKFSKEANVRVVTTTNYLDGVLFSTENTTLQYVTTGYGDNNPVANYASYLPKSAVYSTNISDSIINAVKSGNYSGLVGLPEIITGSYRNVKGVLYYYRVVFSKDSKNTYYSVEWGTTSSYGVTFITRNVAFNESDYKQGNVILINSANSDVSTLCKYLDTMDGSANIKYTPIYATVSDDEITVLSSNRKLRCYNNSFRFNNEVSDVSGYLGYGGTSNTLYQTLYTSVINKQATSTDGGNSRFDCFNCPNIVYLNPTNRQLSTEKAAGFTIPILCIATGHYNKTLMAISITGDIYSATTTTEFKKIGNINGAYRCIIDTLEDNKTEIFFVIDVNNRLYRLSTISTNFTILATADNVKDVAYNATTYYGGRNLIILTTNNELYSADVNTLKTISKQVSAVGLIIHDVSPHWTRDVGYIDLKGVPHTYGFTNNPTRPDTFYTPMSTPNIDMIPRVPDTFIGVYTPINSIEYKYKVSFEFEGDELKITTRWGVTEDYNEVFSIERLNLTTATYNTIYQTSLNVANDQLNLLKQYLETIIGSITAPALYEKVYTTRSGKKFYFRTTYTVTFSNEKNGRIKYVTEYGPDRSYANQYSIKSHEINPSNYASYESDLTALADNERNEIIINKLRIWDFILPVSYTEEWANKGGIAYYIKRKYTQGPTTDTTNSIRYNVSWGDSLAGSEDNQYLGDTFIVNINNLELSGTQLTAIVDNIVANLKVKLDIPNIVPVANVTDDYTVNGFTYSLSVRHIKGEQINIINSVATIDGIQFGKERTYVFLRTQEEAEVEMEEYTTSMMNEMKTFCNDSPADSSEIFDAEDVHFNLENRYVKLSGSRIVEVRTYLDGECYNTTSLPLEASDFSNNITAIKSSASSNMKKLKKILEEIPINREETYTIQGLNFKLELKYDKPINYNKVRYYILCDTDIYSTQEIELSVMYLNDSIYNLKNISKTEYTNLKDLISSVAPVGTNELIKIEGLYFNVGTMYSKDPYDRIATASAILDGIPYGSTSNRFVLSTIAQDAAKLKQDAEVIKTTLRQAIENNAIKNTLYTHAINGFVYKIGSNYSKKAGESEIRIETILDGGIHTVSKININVGQLITSIEDCKNLGVLHENDLKSILDESPANNNLDEYEVNGFVYKVGATYYKKMDFETVKIDLYVDGAIVDTYDRLVTASTTKEDIRSLKEFIETRLNEIKSTLRGMEDSIRVYRHEGFEFALRAHYKKNIVNNTITISTSIDNISVGNSLTIGFVKEDIDKYRAEGERMLEMVKLIADETPADREIEYSVNGFSFTIRTEFTKEADQVEALIYTYLDGNRSGAAIPVTYNPKNIEIFNSNALLQVNELKKLLDKCPADSVNNRFIVSGFGFYTGTNYYKEAGNNKVTINTMLDGDIYGDPIYIDFNVTDIKSITDLSHLKEEEMKDFLRQVPIDNDQTWVFGKFAFYVENLYSKTPGDKTVRSYLKIDGSQYGEVHLEYFEVEDVLTLGDFLTEYTQRIKNKYELLVPKDVHTTYSKNGFNFNIDIKMSKEAGTDVVDIGYTIDKLDTNMESIGTVELVTSTTMDNLSNTIDNLTNG